MNQQKEIKNYLRQNYPELFVKNEIFITNNYSSLYNFAIGFFYKAKKDFLENNINCKKDLEICKKHNDSAIDIFCNYPIKCKNWFHFFRPGRFNSIDIIDKNNNDIKFTSLTGIHNFMAECRKNDYGVIFVPLATINEEQNKFFEPIKEINVNINRTNFSYDNALCLLNKIMKDEVVMKKVVKYFENFGDLKSLNKEEMLNIKKFWYEQYFAKQDNISKFDLQL